jgi:uncharacterized protein YlaI
MKNKSRKTLQQMQAESMTQDESGLLVCDKCGCMDFRTYATKQLSIGVQRYRQCRNCGRKVVTLQARERYLRDVDSDS